MIKSVNIEEAAELIKANDDIQLLDTRSDMEVEVTGIIEGSILVDIVNNHNFDKIISNSVGIIFSCSAASMYWRPSAKYSAESSTPSPRLPIFTAI